MSNNPQTMIKTAISQFAFFRPNGFTQIATTPRFFNICPWNFQIMFIIGFLPHVTYTIFDFSLKKVGGQVPKIPFNFWNVAHKFFLGTNSNSKSKNCKDHIREKPIIHMIWKIHGIVLKSLGGTVNWIKSFRRKTRFWDMADFDHFRGFLDINETFLADIGL